ncbi:type II toxin-antitoxin system CcdA family antitoxin [Aliidiomarina quisquiliarum]|uniref:type II toxin-antitoxin system CcdA family antitoxin n=1 Tax=Aliidiomarina quisquiliarum TaxID=2938947 RepID=UPI003B849DD8
MICAQLVCAYNVSRTAESGIQAAVVEEKRKLWLQENAAAIDSSIGSTQRLKYTYGRASMRTASCTNTAQ